MDAVVAGIIQGGIYAAFTLSLAIIFSVMGVVNFAHGDFLTVAFYATALLLSSGVALGLALFAVIVLMTILGVLLYLTIFRATQRAKDPALAQVFATVGLSMVIQNVILLIYGGDTRRVTSIVSGSVDILGVPVTWSRLLPTFAVSIMSFCLLLLFKRTVLGTRIRAVAADRESAAISGIHVQRTFVMASAISFGILAVAAFSIAHNVSVFPLAGFNLLLVGFLAAVIGGLGSVFAAVGGAFALGVIESVTSTYAAPIYAPIGMYSAFLLILLIRPHGIAGVAR